MKEHIIEMLKQIESEVVLWFSMIVNQGAGVGYIYIHEGDNICLSINSEM